MAQTQQSEPDQDSIDYYLQIVESGEKQVGMALASIGYLYQKSGKYNTALSYFDQALPLLNGQRKSLEVGKIHIAKGTIYEFFGDNAQPTKYYALARASYLKSAETVKDLESGSLTMSINQHLADIATKRGNFNRAVIYQNRVIKALTQLYQDSLQSQSESFNDLLNKEIESSKDTIFVQPPEASEVKPAPVPWSNWRHIAIVVLLALLLLAIIRWISLQRSLSDLQQEIEIARLSRKQLLQQKEEIQTLNLKLTKTEKQQRRSNMTKDKIFSIISHDLRSPINTIAGFLNILGAKMATIGDIELKKLTAEVTESTERLTVFLDDLLKWSMSQLGQLKPKIEKIDLRKIVQENYLLVKPQLKAKNIHFKASVPTDIDIYADSNMLRLILRNLIGNSIKFTRKDGYIAVILRKGTQGPVIEVSDDGVGMSEDKVRYLFDFKGSEINGGTGREGAGLGLLLCKEFAQLNGGDISVSSQLGEGTTFTVYLPGQPGEVVGAKEETT